MTSEPIILFDGVCKFCNGAVNFLLRQDKEKIFRFAALQSEAGQILLQQHSLPAKNFGSFVLVKGEQTFQKSTAALKLAAHLPWYWQWTQFFWLVPRFVRDGIYDWVARNRYRWFGKKDACMMPSADVQSRFLH